MTYEEIICRIAGDLALPKKLVDRTYRAFWKAIKEHIESLPLKEDLTDEEFQKLQPNVNIPSIGKLHVTLERYHSLKSYELRYNSKKQKYKNNDDKDS